MKKSLLIKNIGYLVSCDKEDRLYNNVNLLIENGVITYIGTDDKQAEKVIDGTNMAVYPGLINAHHHLYQIFSRNLPQVQNMELFPWLQTLYEIWKNIDESVIHYSSLVGFGELLKNGCTTCLDHHYVFPDSLSNRLLEVQFDSASKIGIRMYATRGSMDLSKKDGGLPPDSVVQSIEKILKDSEETVKKYHDSSPYSMRSVALAPCSPFSVTGELMKESAKLARKLGVRLHTHLAETKDEEKYTLKNFGMRPLEYMESLGWTGSDVWYAHGIHFSDEELKLLAKTKTGIAHCPVSNMKLSSGIAKIPEMLKLNVPVGLGVDGSASNDGSSLLEEIRVAYLLHRLRSSVEAPTGYEILKIATNGSAKILGRDDLGELSTGKAGDLFMVDMNRLELVGAQFDVKSMLGTIGLKNGVDYTVVNGEVVVEKGNLVKIDEETVSRKSNIAMEDYLRR